MTKFTAPKTQIPITIQPTSNFYMAISQAADTKSIEQDLDIEDWICPYLDNFVTNPIYILPYSGDSDPNSPEYAKICMHMVTKLSRYRHI